MTSPTPLPGVARRWPLWLRWAFAMLFFVALCAPASALASAGSKVVRYRGALLRVPASWPVFDLSVHPTVCVRFNRHAVYLGQPGADQHCPPNVAGRTEAVLVQPAEAQSTSAVSAAGASALPLSTSAAAGVAGGSLARVLDRAHGVVITATWNRDPAVVETLLRVRSLASLASLAAASQLTPAPAPAAARRLSSRVRTSASVPGGTFTGFGFDACSAPSPYTMSVWQNSSPFQAVGVYIGGINESCSQPNLTSSWVSQESAAGWHLLPVYVGLQAPTNSCSGCLGISTTYPTSQGTAAADDAVARAKALGIGAGNPIYDDMEYYPTGGTNSWTVETFLGAWTRELHALGYKSGVYSSDSAGIKDLVSLQGTGYAEPDDLWIANWNYVQNTTDPYVPASEWANHQRVHQYNSWTATYGGITIGIDGDWVDGATAAAGTAAAAAGPPPVQAPVASAAPSIAGAAAVGQTLSETHGTWSNSPTSYAYTWERCNASGGLCAAISGASGQSYAVTTADIGSTLRVVETAANSGGHNSSTSTATAVVPVPPVSSYWLYTAFGNVWAVGGKAFYGSPWHSGISTASIVGMAATADEHGYWLANSAGDVYTYGDARVASPVQPIRPVIGIVAAPGGGYWLYTASGNVYNAGGAPWYGSPWHSGVSTSSIVGMTATRDGRGYWLVTATGKVYAFGDAAAMTALATYHPIKGIVASATGGFWEYNVFGNVPYTSNTPWFGSPSATDHLTTSSITGMAATPDAQGYWVVTAAGNVYGFGDAAAGPAVVPGHPVIGIVG